MKKTPLISLLRILAGCCLCHGVAASAADVSAIIKDAEGKPVNDAVVLAFPAKGGATAAKAGSETMDQVDKEFVPRVKPIRVGTSVRFPNQDNTRHQVYSFSAAKKFELPLYAGKPAAPVVFDKPGVVTLGCNIHDWMLGYIYVADTPYFGKTDAEGKTRIGDLPPGDYTLKVWHPRMIDTEESTARRVSTAAAKEAAWTLKLKPEFRIRRAPGAGNY